MQSALSGMRDGPPIQFDEDIGLMLKAREGDRSAYDRIYTRYYPAVISFLSRRSKPRHACEDMAQEVFTRAWQCRTRYQPLAPVKSYLLGVAVNVLRESQAKARVRTATDVGKIGASMDTDQPSPSSRLESEEQIQAVHALMASLSVRQRQAVELVYLAELPPDEAARQLGCSVTALYSYLCSARRRFCRAVCPTQKE